jgi:hypothetical protein
MVNDT